LRAHRCFSVRAEDEGGGKKFFGGFGDGRFHKIRRDLRWLLTGHSGRG
jgi:hypothetical protein